VLVTSDSVIDAAFTLWDAPQHAVTHIILNEGPEARVLRFTFLLVGEAVTTRNDRNAQDQNENDSGGEFGRHYTDNNNLIFIFDTNF